MAIGDPPPNWFGPQIVMYGGCPSPEPFKPAPYVPYGQQPETTTTITLPSPEIDKMMVREIVREELAAFKKLERKWVRKLVKRLIAKARR
jgi:hypothetical protein